MKILMVVAYFVPEIGSAAHVYFDLARALVKKGHEVEVLTSYPRNFNLNENDKNKEYQLEETIDGIQIHRSKHLARRNSVFMRGLEHFLLPFYYFKRYRKLGRKFDVCLMYLPPLPLYYLSAWIRKYDDTLSILNYQDFHPQELTDVGMMKNRFMIKLMEYIEKESYRNADFITVLSRGGINYITNRGGKINKIEHIYNGACLSDCDSNLSKNNFKTNQGIENKLLITYVGILSLFQGIDSILDAAKEISIYEDIIFYIIGDGMIKAHLLKRIHNEKISNVRLLPLQSREEYYNILNSSDISIVSLDERMKAPCIPGKIINLMATKKPIIAIVPGDSETAKVIRQSKSGIIVNPKNKEDLKKSILFMKNNPEIMKDLGNNGREFFEANMDIDKTVLKYEQIFKNMQTIQQESKVN